MPWGTTRYTYGSSPTTFQYTGQRIETSLGLLFYNARFYDPSLARFIQADSIVPGGVQGLDRYAYSYNNPVKYTDPNGHDVENAEYIYGWDKSYKQKQEDSTCAVLAVASVLTFVTGNVYTQADVQPTFPSTYHGIGVLPVFQERGLNKLLDEAHKDDWIAKHLHGTRDDILTYLQCDLPVIVNIAIPWGDGIGHSLVAVGIDPDTGQIAFYNPADGRYYLENEIKDWYEFCNSFNTFEDLLEWNNLILGSGSLVTIQQNLVLGTNSPTYSSGGGTSYALSNAYML